MASHRFQSAFVLVASLVFPEIARGQETAVTFEQLRFVLSPGSEIRVVDADGKILKGRFDRISDQSLAMTIQGRRVTVDQDTVIRIEERHDDSVANGARNGFYVGAGFGLLGSAAILMEGGSPAFLPIVTAVYGGIGAGIGVAIDAMIRTQRIVYDVRPGRRRWLSRRLSDARVRELQSVSASDAVLCCPRGQPPPGAGSDARRHARRVDGLRAARIRALRPLPDPAEHAV